MIKTFKYKLYKSKKLKKIHSSINLASQIYNHCIALHKRYYSKYHKFLQRGILQKHITKLKRLEKYEKWNLLNAQSVQQITDRIDNAYTLFFNNIKQKKKARPPKFKSYKKYKSFTLKQTSYKMFASNGIKIHDTNYRFFNSRAIEGTIKTITVKRDPLGEIYLFFVCEVNNPKIRVMTGKTAGFDFGLKIFLTSSDEEKIESPEFYKKSLNKVKQAHRKLSKKVKGSKNREKARLSLSRRYKEITNRKTDFFFKLSKQLTDRYDELYFESLSLDGMKALWGRKVSDLSFHTFLSILEKYCQKTGTIFLKIGKWEATSKTCRFCGYKNDDLTLEDRTWTCPSCKAIHDRDINAAYNIKTVGTSTVKGEEVRLSELVKANLGKHSSLSTLESHRL